MTTRNVLGTSDPDLACASKKKLWRLWRHNERKNKELVCLCEVKLRLAWSYQSSIVRRLNDTEKMSWLALKNCRLTGRKLEVSGHLKLVSNYEGVFDDNRVIWCNLKGRNLSQTLISYKKYQQTQVALNSATSQTELPQLLFTAVRKPSHTFTNFMKICRSSENNYFHACHRVKRIYLERSNLPTSHDFETPTAQIAQLQITFSTKHSYFQRSKGHQSK